MESKKVRTIQNSWDQNEDNEADYLQAIEGACDASN